MTKNQFLKILRSSLPGVSHEQVSEVVADYEEYFRDGLASGRSEAEIAEGLGDPAKIARELRCEMRIQAWHSKKSVGNLGRVILALLALGSLNLFLAIPMLLLMCILTVSYCLSIVLLLVGLAAMASYLPGLDPIVQFRHAGEGPIHMLHTKGPHKVEITGNNEKGIDIHVEDLSGSKDIHVEDAEESGGVHIDLEDLHSLSVAQARALTAIGGPISGALLLLVNLWVTRLLIRGFVKYARLNYSILRGE